MNLRSKYPLILWRPFFDIIITCYVPIIFAILLSSYSLYFYPLSLIILANRILCLSLICHEGLHGTLFEKASYNTFVARWFCAYPTWISFSKYRKLHLLHHRAIGNQTFDPDYHLYSQYPISAGPSFLKSLYELFTFRILLKFISYYTEIFDIFKSPEGIVAALKKNRLQGDFIGFVAFHLVVFSLVFYFGVINYYLLFLFAPLFLITQPYVLWMGGLQHGPIQNAKEPQLLSRSIRGAHWLMTVLLPLDINYHAEHHLNPSVPHYWLKDFSVELKNSNMPVWTSNYYQALKDLTKQN